MEDFRTSCHCLNKSAARVAPYLRKKKKCTHSFQHTSEKSRHFILSLFHAQGQMTQAGQLEVSLSMDGLKHTMEIIKN